MELNAGVILAPSNVHTKAPLEPASYKQTQVDRMQSWMHVEFVHSPTSLPFKSVQHPIQIDTYIFLVAKYLGETFQT